MKNAICQLGLQSGAQFRSKKCNKREDWRKVASRSLSSGTARSVLEQNQFHYARRTGGGGRSAKKLKRRR